MGTEDFTGCSGVVSRFETRETMGVYTVRLGDAIRPPNFRVGKTKEEVVLTGGVANQNYNEAIPTRWEVSKMDTSWYGVEKRLLPQFRKSFASLQGVLLKKSCDIGSVHTGHILKKNLKKFDTNFVRKQHFSVTFFFICTWLRCIRGVDNNNQSKTSAKLLDFLLFFFLYISAPYFLPALTNLSLS